MEHNHEGSHNTDEQSETDLISEITTFIGDSEGADSDERELFVKDLNKVYDEAGQWEKSVLDKRLGRPSYTFNRLIGPVNQVIGEQRMFRPSIKLRGVDDKTDQELAEVMSGMIRNIEAISDAESIYDMAFKYQVAGGYGAWRVVTEFQNDKSFDQEIFIKAIHNVLTVFFDPLSMDPVKRDQTKCVIAERISRDFYKEKYGRDGDDIAIGRDSNGWVDEKSVRIAEYFKLVPVEKEIALMSDGRTVPFDDDLKKIQDELDGEDDTPTVERTRKVSTFQVKWWKVDGANILEGPITYDWRFIPVVKLPGRFVNIEGKQKTQSLVRHAHDPQDVYNFDRTTMSEVLANAPRAPYLMTADNIKGFEKEWASAGSKNAPYLLYKFDKNNPKGPERTVGADVPAGFISLAAQDADDIKHATGFHDASLGLRGNEVSGEAIARRQRSADIGSYEFYDNLKKAIKFTGDILVDMMPTVYDTPRVVRILGLDGQEDFKQINAFDKAADRSFDISQGLYDVTVDIGPTFSTQREEAFATMLDAVEKMPIIAEIAPDLVVKAMPGPDSDELVARLRKRGIASGVIEPTEEEKEDIVPPAPNPVEEALVENEKSKADLNQARTGKTLMETLEIQTQIPVKTKQLESDLVSSTTESIRKLQE